jgi:hypothetical protein
MEKTQHQHEQPLFRSFISILERTKREKLHVKQLSL